MTDYRVVKDQMDNLWKLGGIPLILNYKHPKITNTCIGELSGKFTYSNYFELYNGCLNDENYQVLMQDESMISMYYFFDSGENIIKYNLSFIPSLNGEINQNNCEINNIIKDVETYLRIDFDTTGYEKIFHEKQHLHLGLNSRTKTNERNILRIPIAEKLYPWDFIFLVLKLIYHMDNEHDKLFRKYNRSCSELIKIEEQIWYIKFNKI